MTIKNILIFYKTSTYSRYALGGKILSPKHFYEKELHRFERTHQTHYEALARVVKILKHSGIPYQLRRRRTKMEFSFFDLVITVGGDGTFLEAARGIKDQIILGVNSDPQWSVGRFCRARPETFERVLRDVLNGRAAIKKIPRFFLSIDGNPNGHNVLNDILISHQNPAAMSRYYLTVGAVTEEQKSSGIWISTAAGSTGAICSAGGKIMPETSRKIQYRPRELYQGKKNHYQLPGGILRRGEKLQLTSLMRDGAIYVDGAHVRVPFGFGHTASVTPATHDLRVAAGERG